MHTNLLSTKLYFPSIRPAFVPRPKLVERLHKGLEGTLTIVSAPAGYGKTTLLSEWRHGPGALWRAAWLSLDEGDNDPARFYHYLAASLESVHLDLLEKVLPLLETPPIPSPETILTPLVNSLGDVPGDLILVLDDYHLINAAEVHSGLSFLLEHAPQNMHLVLLTRADPPLPLPRLRARGQLTEIRLEHLRFTVDEAAAFLHRVMGLDLTGGQVAALEKRTEGWIAGLQLAALSMQGREDLDEFLSAFTGSNRYIMEYLAEEVLARQPEPIRDFVLTTSILERLTGPLCDVLTGRQDGAAILTELERNNLFVVPLDDEQRWYRMHPLLAEFLRKQLKSFDSEKIPELHRRASRWHEIHGDADFAIRHSLYAGDWDQSVSLMEAASQEAIQRGEVYKIKGWVEALPASLPVRAPHLLINFAWAVVLNGEFDKAGEILEKVEPLVQKDPALKTDWLAVLVFTAVGKGQPSDVIQVAKRALEFGESGNILSRCQLLSSLSVATWQMGRVRETADVALEAAELAERGHDWHTRSIMLARHALAQAAQGNLKIAEKIYAQAVHQPANIPATISGGIAEHYLGALYYEWDELEKAFRCIQLAEEYSRTTGHMEINIHIHRQLAALHLARGESQKATQSLDQADSLAQEHHLSAKLGSQLAASRFQIALSQGDLQNAACWLEQIQDGFGASFHYPRLPLEDAKLALARGEKERAEAILAQRIQAATQDGIRYAQIEIRILQALASDRIDDAMTYLSEALTWAERESFIRIFSDQGRALIPLLTEASRRGIAPAYSTRLLHAILTGTKAPGRIAVPKGTNITKREAELLSLIAEGSSNKEIAERLVISLDTVKRHTTNIFNKLAVKNRTEAVARARELGLL